MQYRSTRGHAEPQSSSHILLGGLAPDGGLYLPEQYPQVSVDELTRQHDLPYADLAFEIPRKFTIGVPEGDLRALTHRTCTPDVYCSTRIGDSIADITPLHKLDEGGGTSLSLLYLSNGPTLVFRDMAIQLLGNLSEYALDREHAELDILGATSGDMGNAAEYVMRGKHDVRVFMLSPRCKVSALQITQMFSLQDRNISSIAIEGVFDDVRDIIKAASNDFDYEARQKVGTVNSVNWACVVAQVAYYLKGYLPAAPKIGDKVSLCVPPGNFGNVYTGRIMRMMGLSIDELIVTTNENDMLDEFFRTGTHRVRSTAQTYHTSNLSMDISKASNFGRFVFDLLDRNPMHLAQLFRNVDERGGFLMTDKPKSDRIVEPGFASSRSPHDDRVDTIHDVLITYGTMIDTYTTDGVKVVCENLTSGVPMVVLEAALPTKFGDAAREALDREPERPVGCAGIEPPPQRFEVIPIDIDRIKDYTARYTGL